MGVEEDEEYEEDYDMQKQWYEDAKSQRPKGKNKKQKMMMLTKLTVGTEKPVGQASPRRKLPPPVKS